MWLLALNRSCLDTTTTKKLPRRESKSKKDMKLALDVADLFPDLPESVAFEAKCVEWLAMAQETSQTERDRLIDYEAVKIYALNHPKKTASEVLESCKVEMDVSTICKMRREANEEIGRAANLKKLIQNGGHHLLVHDEKNKILVFGTSAALHYLSVTPIIQCDGTFTCLVLPFTQLYIFHAVLGNGVTYPMLYCLVKGKKQKRYVRLLKLIEAIAMREINKPIFKHPVQVMMDFEKAMINAIRKCSTEAQVVCCFFLFTSNVRKHSVSLMAAIKSAVGQNPEKWSLA